MLLLALAAETARAESSDKDDASESDPCMSDAICRAHYNRARKLSKKDDYEGALEAYESAYRRKPVSWLLINLGRSLHKLGRTQDAIQNYQRFLGEKDARPELKQKTEQFLREAQSDLVNKPAKEPPKKDPAQSDSVAGGPGNLPPTENGTQGGKPAAGPGDANLGTGDSRSLPGSSTQTEPVGPQVASVTPPAPPPSRLGALFYGGAAVGGALIAGGVVTGAFGLTSANTLHSTPYAGAVDASTLPALQNRVRGLGYATDILIPVGVATIAITTIVSLVRKPSTEKAKKVVPAVDPIPPVISSAPVAPVVAPSAAPVATPAVIPSAVPVTAPAASSVATPAEAPATAPNPTP